VHSRNAPAQHQSNNLFPSAIQQSFPACNPTIFSCLQDYLVKWPKTLMVVSHARDFLNMVCTDILHLHSRKLTSYKGDFDTFERTATERLRNAKKAAEGQERQRAHMQVCLGSRVKV
jgi:ATPase subunit of ABC transporter with duplicated ATPase domains